VLGRLGRVAVLGVLDGELGHLAFDGASVGAVAAGWEEFEEQLLGGCSCAAFSAVGGKARV